MMLLSCFSTYKSYLQNCQIRTGLPDIPAVVYKGRKGRQIALSGAFNSYSSRDYSYYLDEHSKVDSNGVSTIDTVVECINNLGSNGPSCIDEDRYYVSANGGEFTGKNVAIRLPKFSANATFDISLFKPVSLLADFGLSKNGDKYLWRALFGATGGYEFRAVAVSGGLFVGLQDQIVSYIVIRGSPTTGYEEVSEEIVKPVRFLRGHIGVNSAKELLAIIPYVNVGYSYVDLLTIKGGIEGYNDYRFGNNMYFWTLKTGAFKDIGRLRILAGFTLHLLDDVLTFESEMKRLDSYYLTSYPFLSITLNIPSGER
jgi:hypothetical protein